MYVLLPFYIKLIYLSLFLKIMQNIKYFFYLNTSQDRNRSQHVTWSYEANKSLCNNVGNIQYRENLETKKLLCT